MSEFAEAYKAIDLARIEEGKINRRAADMEYRGAAALAYENGFMLIRHSESHYAIEHKTQGWRINIYPGNYRLFADRQRPPAPFLRVKQLAWGLLDVVRTAIDFTRD